jgi:hypothetical protein
MIVTLLKRTGLLQVYVLPTVGEIEVEVEVERYLEKAQGRRRNL